MCILSCPTSSIANCKTCTYSADNFWLTYVNVQRVFFLSLTFIDTGRWFGVGVKAVRTSRAGTLDRTGRTAQLAVAHGKVSS